MSLTLEIEDKSITDIERNRGQPPSVFNVAHKVHFMRNPISHLLNALFRAFFCCLFALFSCCAKGVIYDKIWAYRFGGGPLY